MASASDKASQVQRRVRGLLNRMSDSNLPGIVSDMLQLTEQEGERVIADAVTTELLQANLLYSRISLFLITALPTCAFGYV